MAAHKYWDTELKWKRRTTEPNCKKPLDNIYLPEALEVSEIQHVVIKVGKYERKDGILHEIIERTSRHFV